MSISPSMVEKVHHCSLPTSCPACWEFLTDQGEHQWSYSGPRRTARKPVSFICTLFPRLAARRTSRSFSTETAPGGESPKRVFRNPLRELSSLYIYIILLTLWSYWLWSTYKYQASIKWSPTYAIYWIWSFVHQTKNWSTVDSWRYRWTGYRSHSCRILEDVGRSTGASTRSWSKRTYHVSPPCQNSEW